MKPTLEPVPTAEVPKVEEIDYLRLLRAGEDARLAASSVTDLQLRSQMLTMKIGMCDLTKSSLQGQLRDLQAEEKKASALHDGLEKQYRDVAETAFKKKYGIPPESKYSINPMTYELTIA